MGLAVEVKNLSYVYPDGTRALNDVSFQVEEGECIGIIGHLDKGKVVASGSVEEILTNETLLKLYELSPPTMVKLFKGAGYNYAPLTLNEGIKFLRRENGRI